MRELVAFRRTLVTLDVMAAVNQLERRAVELGGIRLVIQGPTQDRFSWAGVKAEPGPTGQPPATSMRATGRELQIRVQILENGLPPADKRRREVETLWGLAVPCGFTPWNRYPVPGHGDDVFHYLGPWQVLCDSLLGEGRGEEAWPSLCAAAQVDVGKWEGDRTTERFVQAQVHRLGVPCGPIDGVVGERTIASLRGLGLAGHGKSFSEMASRLSTMTVPEPRRSERRRGFISVDGPAVAVSSGKVALTKNLQGYAITVDGPGRVILDVGDDA